MFLVSLQLAGLPQCRACVYHAWFGAEFSLPSQDCKLQCLADQESLAGPWALRGALAVV